MPYIKPQLRKEVDKRRAFDPGELNYKITTLLDDYIRGHGVSYHTINNAIGVLECAKLELYRRIATPYEDKKKFENGDVYSKELIDQAILGYNKSREV